MPLVSDPDLKSSHMQHQCSNTKLQKHIASATKTPHESWKAALAGNMPPELGCTERAGLVKIV